MTIKEFLNKDTTRKQYRETLKMLFIVIIKTGFVLLLIKLLPYVLYNIGGPIGGW
jgi:hypothetical protein